MSLRDQLLAKGLASKKDVRRVEQDLKRDRKQAEGHQRPKSQIEAEEAAAAEAAAAAALAARLDERRRREEARALQESALRVQNLIRSNAIRGGGPIPWHHRIPQSPRIGRLGVSPALVGPLLRGELAIAALPTGRGFDFRLVRRTAAEALSGFAPQLVVFWNADPTGTSAPDQRPLERDWETSLRPHRLALPVGSAA